MIYRNDDNVPKVRVRFEDENIWLTQAQLVELYDSSKANISEHIKNIFDDRELDAATTVRKFRTVQTEGGRQVEAEYDKFRQLELVDYENDYERAIKKLAETAKNIER